MHEMLRRILPNDLVFDIGANRGDKTETFLSQGARVVAVEPQPEMVKVLRERFEGNANVTIVGQGLATEPGMMVMNVDLGNSVISSFRSDWKDGRFNDGRGWDQQIQIPMTTLDYLVHRHGVPRYTKIDVEGFEREVVGGLTRHIGPLSYEFTAETIYEAQQVADKLRSVGYKLFNASFGELEDFVWQNWMDDRRVFNAICGHIAEHDRLLWGDIYAV